MVLAPLLALINTSVSNSDFTVLLYDMRAAFTKNVFHCESSGSCGTVQDQCKRVMSSLPIIDEEIRRPLGTKTNDILAAVNQGNQ